MTDAEALLWRLLRNRRLASAKFRRQHPLDRYILDFYCEEKKLCIEIDGGQHADAASYDSQRTAWLQARDIRVLRFWNNDVLTQIEAVVEMIYQALVDGAPAGSLTPDPSPASGRGEIERRPIRSFVRREGRMTEAQRRALEELWPRYGVALADGGLDPAGIFARRAPLILEIGFGNGDALLAMALARPDWNFLGVEVHRPGVGSLLLRLAAASIDNVRVIVADATEVLARLPAGSLAGVHLFFPDPWPKKRHHKRRLLQPAFAARVVGLLTPDGYLHCATDWDDYAVQMLAVLEATPGLTNVAGPGAYAARPVSRPLTRFERRGVAAGRPARDLLFRRAPPGGGAPNFQT